MNKLFASALIAAAVGFSAVAAQAVPVAPDQASSGMITQVAGGCGVGWHPGPYGCRRNGYYGGRYWGSPVVVAPGVVVAPVVGPCGGRGAHEVCGPYGRCRMVCNY
jgi:hypothetical protein